MNIHATKKTFLSLLLILSLCADIAMTAYAVEYPAQKSMAADEDGSNSDSSGSDEPHSGSSGSGTDDSQSGGSDSSKEDSSNGSDSSDKDSSNGSNSNADGSPSGDSSDNKDSQSGGSSDNKDSQTGSSSDNKDSQSEGSGNNDSQSESSGSSSSDRNLSAEDTPSADLPANEPDSLCADETDNDLTPSAAGSETTFITLSAAGDCTLGIDTRYSHNFNKYYKKKGDSYFFKKVNPIFSQDDITIVNFEGTLTTSKKRTRKTFTFKGPKKYASILKKGSVEVVNLANNHSKDYGRTSLTDTQNIMRKNSIGYCRNTTIDYQTVNGAKMAFLGFNALEKVTKNQIKTGIAQAKKNNAEIIVVSFHWGVERKYYPNAKQKSLGRYAISCGASLVLGHHPHVLQGIEKYKGRYIVYSLGNFCFGGNSNPKDKDTMIFQQTFAVKDGELQPDSNASIIPCSLSSHRKTNDFQPRVLSGKEKKRLIKKMNKLSRKLNVSISSDGKLN